MRPNQIRRACLLLSAFAAMVASAPATGAGAQDYIEENRERILSEFIEFLAIPNVANDPAGIRRNADYLLAKMKEQGLSPRLLRPADGKGPPAVYGEWLVPGARQTIMLYAHYDGQPVTESDWTVTRPFLPVLCPSLKGPSGSQSRQCVHEGRPGPDWRLYARSAADDKAGVMAILTAIASLKADGRKPTANLKIFFDGEEEAGSPHLPMILEAHRTLLASDGWIIVDGPAHPSGPAQAVLGVRGVVTADLTIYGPTRALHSGHYGNWAPNPAMMLSQLLASMKDPDGRVLVDGFYDDVIPLTQPELEAVASVPSVDAGLKYDLGLAQTDGAGKKLAELINQPSLNIDGIRSADVGEAARNIVPSLATATIDMRLVMGNDPDRQLAKLKSHIEAQGYKLFDREPTIDERRRFPRVAMLVGKGGYAASRTPIGHPLARRLITGASAAGPLIVLPTTGGSLPLSMIEKALGVPTVTLSPWNHDNNQHAEDENLRLGNFWSGVSAVASVLTTN